MKTINEIQQEIIKTFKTLENDRIATIEYIIDVGNELIPLEEKYKTEKNLIEGCISKVWVIHQIVNGRLEFKADSNTSTVKGILSLLIKIFNNQTPKDIATTELFFIKQTNLQNIISSQRFIGIDAIIRYIKSISRQYL
jgi:cysteine desulfuration protein SufE